MIYSQSPFMYLLSVIATVGLWRRLKTYLEDYFSPQYSIVVAATVLFHPLSIDALLGPNLLNGTVAFWLFLESLFMQKQNKTPWSLLLVLLASACNIAYSLFPVFYVYKLDQRKKYLIPALLYILLLGHFFWKLTLQTSHNPLTFITYFMHFLVLPMSLNAFTPSLYSYSILAFISTTVILLLILWTQKKNKNIGAFFPLLFLPVIGDLVHQWTESYSYWSEIIFSGSNFLCITFAFVTLIAISLPKKYFVSYFFMTMFFTYLWSVQWKPYSNVLKQSLLNLPTNYPEKVSTKRVIGWQLLHEGKFLEGRNWLNDLSKDYPQDENLKEDLELLGKGDWKP